jgi:mRNA interferase HigB
MWIITRSALRDFWENHADAEEPLKEWFHVADQARWKTPEEITDLFPSASILPDNRVVFNIKGNHYRLVVKIHYNTGVVYIRFVGTHAEYDKIDAPTI